MGEGPFPTELEDEDCLKLRSIGESRVDGLQYGKTGHALPSRMTIGQLLEAAVGKTCLLLVGHAADCTAFNQSGSKLEIFGKLLQDEGFHSKANEILYDGISGKKLKVKFLFVLLITCVLNTW